MQRRCGVRFTRALIATVLGTLGLLGATTATPAVAQADEPTALASITLTSIKPALPRRDGKITLAGTVQNTSKEPLYRPQAIFWRNQAPITGRDGLDQALASASNDPIGARQTDVYQDLYTPAEPYLQPGASVRFSLTASVAALELSPTDGIYLMGVHVLQNGPPAVGRARVFVPVLDDPPDSKLRMTSVVLLSSRPSLVRDDVLSDDHLATEIAPLGRLTTLLDAAAADNMTFAIDPELIEELMVMRSGYRLGDGDPGTGTAAAARWLTAFEQLKKGHDGYRLLYGSPDIAALVANKQQATLQAAATAGDSVESTRTLPLLVLPANGAADQATVEAAEALDPDAIMLADTATQPGSPLLAGPGKAPILSYTSAAFGGGPGPQPQDTAVHLQQRILADTWTQASETDQDSTLGRVRLITNADQADGDDAAVDAPWMERSTVSELLESTPTAWDQDFRYSAAAQESELPAAQLNRVKRLNVSQQTYADLLVQTSQAKNAIDRTTARAVSSFWRRHATAQNQWLQPQQALLDDLLQNRVEISSTRRVSTVAREGVEFPITVRNTLPASATDPNANAVKVRLQFTSDNTQRLRIDPIEVPLIAAGRNETANAKVTAKANGTVPVTAQLVTESGLKVGRPVTIEVKVTQNGTTGWVIALVAGIVLAGSTALRIRQLTSERARESERANEPSEAQEPIDALSSAPPTDMAARHPRDEVDSFDV